jgi:hypothetical protein
MIIIMKKTLQNMLWFQHCFWWPKIYANIAFIRSYFPLPLLVNSNLC